MALGEVRISDEFTHIDRTVENRAEWERRQTDAARRLMSIPADGVVVIVTHVSVIDWLLGRALDASLEEGEAVVVRPAEGTLKVIGRVTAAEWTRLQVTPLPVRQTSP